MTYLSLIKLDARATRARRDIGNPHDMHRTVMQAFPSECESTNARRDFGVLYRLEHMQHGVVPLLVQSQARPDWSHLADGFVTCAIEDAVAVKEIDQALGAIKKGQHLRFKLRANPTKSVPSGPGVRGKRVELVREADAVEWLARQAERSGFRIAQEEVDDFGFGSAALIRATQESQVRARRGTRTVTLGSMLFEGELEVQDQEIFRETLNRGIGRGKAYGLGLLSIARA